MTSQTAMVRRILRTYRSASPAVRAAGHGWYPAAGRIVADIWPERPDLAAGVLAALSPRCQWVTNVAWTRVMVDAARRGLPCPTVSMTGNRDKAWRIANGADPLTVLGGPKVRSFYANVTDSSATAVTVDVWAARAAEGPSWPGSDVAPQRARYRRIADAYRRAGEILAVPAPDVQAVVWCVVRGRTA